MTSSVEPEFYIIDILPKIWVYSPVYCFYFGDVYWMDNKGVGKYQLSAYCKVLAAEFPYDNVRPKAIALSRLLVARASATPIK